MTDKYAHLSPNMHYVNGRAVRTLPNRPICTCSMDDGMHDWKCAITRHARLVRTSWIARFWAWLKGN